MGATTTVADGPEVAPVVVQPGAGLAAKLAEVTREVGHVAESGTNPTFKYSFAQAKDIIEEVRVRLASRNVALLPSVRSVQRFPLLGSEGKPRATRGGNVISLTCVETEFAFVDGETGEMIVRTFQGEGADEADKGLNKAYTACMKYFLRQTFLIPVGDDSEAEALPETQPQQEASPEEKAEVVALKSECSGLVTGTDRKTHSPAWYAEQVRRAGDNLVSWRGFRDYLKSVQVQS